MAEIMNKHFQEVFTRERNWNREKILEINSPSSSEIIVPKQQKVNQLKKLHVSKSHCLDEVANCILRECGEVLVDTIHCAMQCSLKEGEIPQD